MKGDIGGRLLVEGPTAGAPRRDGAVVALHHEVGTPTHDVRRSDTGRITPVVPGPGARAHHVRHTEHPRTGPTAGRRPGRAGRPARPSRVQ
ncbi:DUF1918 domain-containing protein [Kitasatospora sp. NPDC088346]|uniref:DUF1918 domain-containing protein n=1 Tax=Kitasatospora sp. NPDC088346 TaxID=3364073 RepID=UPI0037F94993